MKKSYLSTFQKFLFSLHFLTLPSLAVDSGESEVWGEGRVFDGEELILLENLSGFYNENVVVGENLEEGAGASDAGCEGVNAQRIHAGFGVIRVAGVMAGFHPEQAGGFVGIFTEDAVAGGIVLPALPRVSIGSVVKVDLGRISDVRELSSVRSVKSAEATVMVEKEQSFSASSRVGGGSFVNLAEYEEHLPDMEKEVLSDVPEPSANLLWMLGVFTILARRRR